MLDDSDGGDEVVLTRSQATQRLHGTPHDAARMAPGGLARRIRLWLKTPPIPAAPGGQIQQSAVEAANVEELPRPGAGALGEIKDLFQAGIALVRALGFVVARLCPAVVVGLKLGLAGHGIQAPKPTSAAPYVAPPKPTI